MARPDRSPDHRPTRPAHRRCHARRRDLCRAIRIRRQDRHLSQPVDLRTRTAVGRLGSRAAGIRLAAPLARRRYRDHPRQCALADRRLALRPQSQARGRPPRRRAGAPHHLAVVASPAGAQRYGQQILSPLSARIEPRDPPVAARRAGYCRRRPAAAGADRAMLRVAVSRQSGGTDSQRDAQTLRRTATADPARWRSRLAQSRCADRIADRSPAAAADLHRAQHSAARRAAQRHRPHDADVAILSPWRRQFRAVQRHERHAVGPVGDLARL